jgi:dienelactone hydrolase
MSCCPPNAEKYLAPDYSATGSTITLADGVELYHAGTPGPKAVLLIPDIFGWNGGRTRNIADMLAEQGYYTIVPKLLAPGIDGGTDGDGFAAFVDFGHLVDGLKQFPWDSNLQPKVASCMAHLKASGAEKIGVVGFCWGGWVGAKLFASGMSEGLVTAFAVAHPSIQLEGVFGGDPAALFDTITAPTLLQPANGDSTDYYEDGAWFSRVKAKYPASRSTPYPAVEHGFVPRGDVSNPVTKENVDKALAELVDFLKTHV